MYDAVAEVAPGAVVGRLDVVRSIEVELVELVLKGLERFLRQIRVQTPALILSSDQFVPAICRGNARTSADQRGIQMDMAPAVGAYGG
jgi:hypothetical protein